MIVVEHVAGRVGMARCGSQAGEDGVIVGTPHRPPMAPTPSPMDISVTLITRPIF
jgi:hypothetical protein